MVHLETKIKAGPVITLALMEQIKEVNIKIDEKLELLDGRVGVSTRIETLDARQNPKPLLPNSTRKWGRRLWYIRGWGRALTADKCSAKAEIVELEKSIQELGELPAEIKLWDR
ncbi:hypothetical protein E6O75_ATG09448 [Venturia nashicola]|uniref:Uncharacterized protein n=1 Tax=Venturia nashicola TaxID=86259 RepID=A0A4Z1NIL1_9PEZI|nr:hypothetical protein E6O75_ATG09448 [Venturia nashicola]